MSDPIPSLADARRLVEGATDGPWYWEPPSEESFPARIPAHEGGRSMTDGVHWQDPREPMYNQPACGAPRYAPTATTREAVTCPVCIARTETKGGE